MRHDLRQPTVSNGRLLFAGQDTVELARQYGTPLYLMDEDRIRANCRVYTEAFRSTSAPRPAPVRQQGQLLPAHL
mgnify:CR=1 FL=1